MKAPLRLAVFAIASVAAMTAVPIGAADAVLPRAKPRIVLGTEGAWSLRQTGLSGPLVDVAETASVRPRAVRLVYPPLIEPR